MVLRCGALIAEAARWKCFPYLIQSSFLAHAQTAQLVMHLLLYNVLGKTHKMPIAVHNGELTLLEPDLSHPLCSPIKSESKLLIVLTKIKAPNDSNKINQHALEKQKHLRQQRKVCSHKRICLKSYHKVLQCRHP
jgi:hypothetical protein